jgi:hypothetical protein
MFSVGTPKVAATSQEPDKSTIFSPGMSLLSTSISICTCLSCPCHMHVFLALLALSNIKTMPSLSLFLIPQAALKVILDAFSYPTVSKGSKYTIPVFSTPFWISYQKPSDVEAMEQ